MTTPPPPTPPNTPKPPPNRQRHADIHIRLLEEEKAKALTLADRAGLTLGAFARAAMLGDAGPRAKRRLPADHQTLRAILGQLGRIGGNINQIAKHLNTTQTVQLPELRDALNAYIDIRNAIFAALGMTTTPDEAPDDHQGNQSRKP